MGPTCFEIMEHTNICILFFQIVVMFFLVVSQQKTENSRRWEGEAEGLDPCQEPKVLGESFTAHSLFVSPFKMNM